MAYRGRLINPVMVEIYRLDRTGMVAGAKLDADYREPVVSPTADRKGKRERLERPPIRVPAQIEPDVAFNQQQPAELGDKKTSIISFVCHFQDLERMGLVDPSTGIADIGPSDRVSGWYDAQTSRLLHVFADPPGLYITAASPQVGLRGRVNLLLVTAQSRN
jgi:hypothetical protein